jgi:hypothetical protein
VERTITVLSGDKKSRKRALVEFLEALWKRCAARDPLPTSWIKSALPAFWS